MQENHSLKGNAGCLVMHKGFVLAVQLRKTGKWTLPAGKPTGNETAEETAIRETFEETGLRVSIKKLLHTFTEPSLFYLFEGRLLKEPPVNLAVPLKFKNEIESVAFVHFKNIPIEEFRYPKAVPIISKLIDEIIV